MPVESEHARQSTDNAAKGRARIGHPEGSWTIATYARGSPAASQSARKVIIDRGKVSTPAFVARAALTARVPQPAAASPAVAHNVDYHAARRTPADVARPRGRARGTRAPSGPAPPRYRPPPRAPP